MATDSRDPASFVRGVTSLWQELLRVEQAAPHDNFLDHGGTSVTAMLLLNRLHRDWGLELPIRAFLRDPTLGGVLTALAGLAAAAPASDGPRRAGPAARRTPPARLEAAPRNGPRDTFPTTPAQRRLLFLDRYDGGSPAYQMPVVAVRVEGPLDPDALRTALSALVARHEPLRTTFTLGDELLQVVHRQGELPLAETDLRTLPAAGRQAGADRWAAALAAAPMNVETGPLATASLARLGTEEYLFVLVAHHLLIDGWSVSVLRAELAELYRAAVEGRPPAPALRDDQGPPRPQYADVALRRAERLRAGRERPGLDWWLDRLRDLPARFDLPLADPRPAVPGRTGGLHGHRLPVAVVRRIGALAARAGATPYHVLLAAYLLLLHRYSGRTDLLVGTPVSGREEPGLESLVGLFTNTVVIRADLSGPLTGVGLVCLVRDAALDSFTHQDVPFERIVSRLRLPRDPGANPVFQVFFALHNQPPADPELAGTRTLPLPDDRRFARFDLSLDVTPVAGAMECAWEYRSDLLDRPRAEQLARHWTRLLDGLIEEPDVPVSGLPLLGEEEARALVLHGPPPAGPEPGLAELFAARAGAHPGRVAVVGAGARLTYRDLDRLSDAVAAGLTTAAAGTAPGAAPAPVGIHLPRTPDAVAVMLGVLKAGRPYLPLDPGQPAGRTAALLRDCGAGTVVTGAADAGALHRALAADPAGPPVPVDPSDPSDPSDPAILLVEELLAATASGTADRPHAPARPTPPGALAYITYTSGSTGRPKPVAVRQDALAGLVHGTSTELGFGEDDVWVSSHTFTFDVSAWEIWAPLLTGARLVIATAAQQHAPTGLRALLTEEAVTVLCLTPSVLRELARLGLPEGGALRRVFAGGEALPSDLARTLLDWPAELWNFYGPTEATVWAAVHRVRPADLDGPSVQLGHPVAGTRLSVLNDRLQPLPPGVPGELFIGGKALAEGYYRRPDLTRERFPPDPTAGPGERLYRTGDRVVLGPSGELRFLGRADDQVKIRGFRVELGEVEAALRAAPGVRDAAAALRRRGEHTVLAGYLVPEPDRAGPALARQVLAALAETLPAHLIPTLLTEIPAVPLTPSGKVDRLALPEPAAATGAPAAGYRPPADDVERRLCALWERLLGADRVGRHDDFFLLGGDSLIAMRLTTEAEREFGTSLTLPDVFRHPTVRALAAMLRGPASTSEEPTPDHPTPGPPSAALLEADAVLDAAIAPGEAVR
ncbi:amino acid adenylation domain-containing protein [Streptomyces sp. NPDC127595]|uniref:non-ribosomal peptide synthetase n=1 Tax=Streptomyces sp. NPDC127595 TaxID=3345405 RepID=UPI00363B8A0A